MQGTQENIVSLVVKDSLFEALKLELQKHCAILILSRENNGVAVYKIPTILQ